MLQMANYEFIRKQHILLGKPIRQISRETGYSRQVIRKALKSTEIPVYQLSQPKPKPVIDSVQPIILEWLHQDEQAPPKQRHTATRIYQRLVDEYGFTGGESTVRRYVRQLRVSPPKAFVPLDFPPGKFAQFDWGEVTVLLQGKQVKVQVFCMRCTYSRKIFVKTFFHQKQEALLQGHVDAFGFFGAVPQVVTYDNLTTAVKKVLEGKNREEQERFVQLRAHYLFESYFCDRGKGHQKGQVENLVKFVQKQFFTPVPSVSSLEELNHFLLEKCISYETTTVPRSSLTVGEAFVQEQHVMLPLPPQPLDCCRIVSVKSNTLSMIHFEKNAYSVPVSHASTELTCKVFAERIEVYHGNKLIAQHERCLESGKELLQYDHYLDLLLTRPGAVLYARPLHQAGLPPIYQQFLDKCRHRPGGMKEFVRLLLLHHEFDTILVEESLEEACQKGMFQYDAVRQLLFHRTLPEHRLPQLSLAEDSSVPRIQVKTPDLNQYNRLLQKRCVVH
ncbi:MULTISPECIES: IS21 family transposase [Brevibacillus]|uniref:IS21 family transposase n=1 Tax=Brevibacillus TaxID=55080 RepID=UPI001C2C2C18|nr:MULTISPECIES: IS21 family transposase [Brevibacillus]UED70189.1 IS21 family transposase [Brevibacillus sp. HD3.3A]WDV96486.1 IS21 family transposase [Brevibacillus parabrevis]